MKNKYDLKKTYRLSRIIDILEIKDIMNYLNSIIIATELNDNQPIRNFKSLLESCFLKLTNYKISMDYHAKIKTVIYRLNYHKYDSEIQMIDALILLVARKIVRTNNHNFELYFFMYLEVSLEPFEDKKEFIKNWMIDEK
jgi:hypothetical protein